MGQHVRGAVRRDDRGGSEWKVFWLGGQAQGLTPDERTPSIAEAHDHPVPVLRASLWGATAPWHLVALAGLGVWLLFAPAAFGVDIRSGAADVAHIGGAFVVVVAVIAMAEVVRALRLLGVAAGLGVATLVLATGPDAGYAAALIVTGLAVAALSVPRGHIQETSGDWHRLTK